MDDLTFEHETPPPGFDLSGEASREAEAAAGGIVQRSVVFEMDDDDDALDPQGESGDADDDDALEDAEAAPVEPFV
jgi:hypothetical protein